MAYLVSGERHIWAPLVQKIHQVRQGSKGSDNVDNGNFLWTEPRQPEQKKKSVWSGWFNK